MPRWTVEEKLAIEARRTGVAAAARVLGRKKLVDIAREEGVTSRKSPETLQSSAKFSLP
jgi:hypothetical protein